MYSGVDKCTGENVAVKVIDIESSIVFCFNWVVYLGVTNTLVRMGL